MPILLTVPGLLLLVLTFLGVGPDREDFPLEIETALATALPKLHLLYAKLLKSTSILFALFLPPEATLALGALLLVAIPAALVWRARGRRPAGARARWNTLAMRVPAFLLGLALLADATVAAWWFWDPPCRDQHAGRVMLGSASVAAAFALAGALYLYAWGAHAFLARRKALPEAPPARLALFERILHLAGAQLLVLLVLLMTSQRVPGAAAKDHEATARAAGMRAAIAQGAYRASHGGYTAHLENLVAVDPRLAATPGVTFLFGYAGQTHFTFSTSHAKSCRAYSFVDPDSP